ncbi:MAG: glycosyltransferase [Planctomycetota bacterium]|nr:glycosyltransferase [Planctomycetota bacterium]
MRIQLHSHDSFGLGHLRRTMTLADELRRTFAGSSVLITTGSPCATHFSHAPGIDVVKLPSVTKDDRGTYVPRSLGGEIDHLVELRRRLLLEIQQSFAPDLLIVDHQVLGLAGELDLVLRVAREHGTRTILGVRDIIDAPDVVAREWGHPRVRHALAHEYDRICVYGAPEVFDPREQYPMPPELRERLEFVGYVGRFHVPGHVPRTQRERDRVLVTVGGGEDGVERIETYLDAIELAPAHWDSTLVLGPLFDEERARSIKRRAREIPQVEVQRFHADMPHLLAQSDAVVGMAGYNSVVEFLQSGVPTVLCPRSFPRREQLLRAERMAALGLAECVPSPAPDALRAAVERALARGRQDSWLPPMEGAAGVCRVARELCAAPRAAHAARGLR